MVNFELQVNGQMVRKRALRREQMIPRDETGNVQQRHDCLQLRGGINIQDGKTVLFFNVGSIER